MLVEALTIKQYRQQQHAARTATEEVGRIVAIPSKSESEAQSEGVDWAAVGQYIGEHRRRLGLSKNEASRRARVSNTTWRQIEAGQNDHPTDETLVRMARALLLDPAELMRQCQRRYVEAPSVRDLPPLGPPMALLEVLESDRRLDPRARRVLMELYDLLASR
jgi:transcriptional regulator with XRE-family HTH domain